MATRTCSCCGGSGIVDEGTSDERECPFCWGTGYTESEGDDDNE